MTNKRLVRRFGFVVAAAVVCANFLAVGEAKATTGCPCPVIEQQLQMKLIGTSTSGSSVCECLDNNLKKYTVGDGPQESLSEVIIGKNIEAQPMISAERGQVTERFANPRFNSLVEYYENVWWPRFLAANQVMARETANRSAMDTVISGRIQGAADNNAWTGRVQQQDTIVRQNFTDVESVLCPALSVMQSSLAASAMTNQTTGSLMDRFVREGQGLAEPYNRGYVNFTVEQTRQAVQQGLISPEGNNGANRVLVTGGASNPALWGAQTNANNFNANLTLDGPDAGQPASSRTITVPTDTEIARMYVERLFPNRVWQPLREDQLRPGENGELSRPVAEIINSRDQLLAAQSMFSRPILKTISERSGREGFAAQASAEGILTRAGITGDARRRYINTEGKISEAALDEIRYKVYWQDPQTAITIQSWDMPNNIRGLGVAAGQQITLLYDIRELMKENNQLLSAMGSLMTKQHYEQTEAQAASLGAGN